MKLRTLVLIVCTLEQMFWMAGTAWLVGWHGWSPHWFWLAVLFTAGASPGLYMKFLEKLP